MLLINGCMSPLSTEITVKQRWQSAFNSARFINQTNKQAKARLYLPRYVQVNESFSDVVSCYQVCLTYHLLHLLVQIHLVNRSTSYVT